MQIDLILPDERVLNLEGPLPVDDAIAAVSEGLLRRAIAVELDGEILDRHSEIKTSGRFRILTNKDEESLSVLRHSTAHLMAYAVQELYPEAKFAFGPDVEDGFYYDILVDESFTPDDLVKIEAKMKELAKGKHPFVKKISHDRMRPITSPKSIKISKWSMWANFPRTKISPSMKWGSSSTCAEGLTFPTRAC